MIATLLKADDIIARAYTQLAEGGMSKQEIDHLLVDMELYTQERDVLQIYLENDSTVMQN
jgi:hypothetical protein